MLFVQVPEDKVGKNRVHLDLQADDLAAEVARLVGLGASVVHEKAEWGHSLGHAARPGGQRVLRRVVRPAGRRRGGRLSYALSTDRPCLVRERPRHTYGGSVPAETANTAPDGRGA